MNLLQRLRSALFFKPTDNAGNCTIANAPTDTDAARSTMSVTPAWRMPTATFGMPMPTVTAPLYIGSLRAS
jgi:hypothetical protein